MATAAGALSASHLHPLHLRLSTTATFRPRCPDHERQSLRCCPIRGIICCSAKGREYRRGCNSLTFRPWNVNAPGIGDGRIEINHLRRSPFVRCHCFGSATSYDGATTPEFVTLVDQMLLMASIFLTYVAGVVPDGKTVYTARKGTSQYEVDKVATSPGSGTKNNDPGCPLEITKRKILDALEVISKADALGGGVLELEKDQTKRPLLLHAIAEGPRFRLLLAALAHIEKEVLSIPGSFLKATMDDWMVLFSDIVSGSTQPVCTAWFQKELSEGNSDMNEELVTTILEKLEGSSLFPENIKKSGKGDLYAELLCFLKFGSVREDCYYSTSLFISQGTAILEDLVIALANSIANVYLELISLDGNMSNELNDLGPVLCSLSTRALQRLRNEVALNGWLHQNMEAVVSMYEDRFDLSMLQSRLLEEPNVSGTEKFDLWRKIFRRNSSATTQLQYVVITDFSIPVKRTKELRALTGWRYYFSLFLELSDITMPLVRTFISKVSDAITFFLVCLIGRSLGLIYTGIRQSLRWK
ncbi:hypothetical protein MLD38_013289 [Melastoma candidum]|uniref:Uncharacterized protein n=1 Tax=Melastoma candidum TaxID=119954 RepID=A0ACB9R8H7_9MYRT|nr:hypothetical protein MLD38_013289 [Melastoma candidum]